MEFKNVSTGMCVYDTLLGTIIGQSDVVSLSCPLVGAKIQGQTFRSVKQETGYRTSVYLISQEVKLGRFKQFAGTSPWKARDRTIREASY